MSNTQEPPSKYENAYVEDSDETLGKNSAIPEEPNLQTEIDHLKQDLLRAMAETENVRKRAQKEREDALKYAISGFARDLTTISENFSRALESVPEESLHSNDIFKSFFDGINMTERELLSVFDRHGIKKVMPTIGDKFDHNYHQSMFETEDDSHPAGTIIHVLGAGYTLHDRLLKPAFVGVSKKVAPKTEHPVS